MLDLYFKLGGAVTVNWGFLLLRIAIGFCYEVLMRTFLQAVNAVNVARCRLLVVAIGVTSEKWPFW